MKIWILKRQLLDDSLAPEERREIMKELEKEKEVGKSMNLLVYQIIAFRNNSK